MATRKRKLHPNNPNAKFDQDEFHGDMGSLQREVMRANDAIMVALGVLERPASVLRPDQGTKKDEVLKHLKEAQDWLEATHEEVNSLVERLELAKKLK